MEKDRPCVLLTEKANFLRLASNQIDFKTKSTPRSKEGHFKMIIRIIHQEDITL